MADSYIGITEGSGSKLDAEQLTVSSTAVKRERVQVAGTGAAEVQAVLAADPAAGAYGSVVRLVGQVAHDAADIGSPVKIGGKASISEATSPVDADRVDAWFATSGALMTHPLPVLHQKTRIVGAAAPLTINRATSTSTSGTATQIVAAGGSGVYTYVIGVALAAVGTAGSILTVETSAPATLWQIPIGANAYNQVFAPTGMYLFRSTVNDVLNVKWTIASQAPTSVLVTLYYAQSSVNI